MLGELRKASVAREFLRRNVPFFHDYRDSLQSLEVDCVFPRADWVIVYRISGPNPDRGEVEERLLVAHHFPKGKFDKAAARIRRQVRRVVRRDSQISRMVAECRAENLVIYPFPLDPKLPSLVDAASPNAFRKVVGSQPGWLEEGQGIESCEVQPVRYVPGRRCQLRYTLHFADGRRRRVFGKIMRDGNAGRLYDSTTQVARLFEGNGAPDLTTPRPLAYMPGWGMVLQEEVKGITLHEMLQLKLADTSHMRAAARSIAVLHNGRLELDRKHLVEDEWDVVLRSYERLRSNGCDEPPFQRVLEKIRDSYVELPAPTDLVPVHRDFYDKQLLVNETGIALIDLDTLALGFRGIDVANFLAHLRLRALQNNTVAGKLSRWEHAFVQEYKACAASPLDSRLQFFFAATALFRLACLYRVLPQGGSWVPELLRFAEEAIRRKDLSRPAVGESVQAGVKP